MRANLVAQSVKNLRAVILGQEDPLEKEMATGSSILAWRIPWTEGPGGLQSMGSQRVRHNLVTKPTSPMTNDVGHLLCVDFPSVYLLQ